MANGTSVHEERDLAPEPQLRYVNAYTLAGGSIAGNIQLGEAKHSLGEALDAGSICGGISGFATLRFELRDGAINSVAIVHHTKPRTR